MGVLTTMCLKVLLGKFIIQNMHMHGCGQLAVIGVTATYMTSGDVMTICWGYLSLALSFLAVSGIFLLLIIRSVKQRRWWRFLLAPAVVWFAFVLLYTPSQLLGWAATERTPEKLWALGVHVIEPHSGSPYPGGIFVWGVPWVGAESLLSKPAWPYRWHFNFMRFDKEPKGYRIPYSKELHKELMKKRKDSKGGIMLFERRGKKGKKGKKKGGYWVGDDEQDQYRLRELELSDIVKKVE